MSAGRTQRPRRQVDRRLGLAAHDAALLGLDGARLALVGTTGEQLRTFIGHALASDETPYPRFAGT